MTLVVDASMVVAGLTDSGADGRWAESLLAGEALAAPHLMPVEAANILRRAALAGDISADMASLAHTDLLDLRVEFFPYQPCAARVWRRAAHRQRLPGRLGHRGSPWRRRGHRHRAARDRRVPRHRPRRLVARMGAG